ncbi:MAG: tyrosine-type recombinase/integrase [bacterium]|nr:tyrosine-type recombinase/integrase [bacterium]MCM1376211.1 tyrosine-type recombinase/integrase [Muribaculum sp.]
MNTAQPIRNKDDLAHIKEYYRAVRPNSRNYLLIIIGLNTALRVSDIVQLKWQDVYDFDSATCREHIRLVEQKTKKSSVIFLNDSVRSALDEYRLHLMAEGTAISNEDYLFGSYGRGDAHITRIQAFRLIKRAAAACGIEGVISCHSLRKTFGYHAWKQGMSPVLLMNIYNHSSFRVTQRYLGIEQDDRDMIFQNIKL